MTQSPATYRLRKRQDGSGGCCKASATSAVHGITFPSASMLALRHFLPRLVSSSAKCSLPQSLLQSLSVVGGNWVAFISWCVQKATGTSYMCRELEEAGAYPFLGEFFLDGKNTLDVIFSLVVSFKFRVISLLLFIVVQINSLHPVQIIAMFCVQSWGGEPCSG